jgi:hypothetical protein
LTFGVVVGGPSPSYIITSLEVNRLNLDSVCVGDHSSCRRCFLSLWFSSSPPPRRRSWTNICQSCRARERERWKQYELDAVQTRWLVPNCRKEETDSLLPSVGNWFDLSELYRWQTWLYWIRFLCAVASC